MVAITSKDEGFTYGHISGVLLLHRARWIYLLAIAYKHVYYKVSHYRRAPRALSYSEFHLGNLERQVVED